MTLKEFLNKFFEEYWQEEDEFNSNLIFRSFRRRLSSKCNVEVMIVDNNGDWVIDWAMLEYEIEDCKYAEVEVTENILEIIKWL